MEDDRIKSVKYYVKIKGELRLAIKLYKTSDNKYHRFIAIISNKKEYTEKELRPGSKIIKCLVSPKKSVTKYLNEYGNTWITTGKCNLPADFSSNATLYIKNCLLYNYGVNKAVLNYEPKRYESNIKLFDWEFRMFHKPEDQL